MTAPAVQEDADMPTKRQRRAQPSRAAPPSPAIVEFMLTGRRPANAPDDEDAMETFLQIGTLIRGGGAELFQTHRLELLKRWTATRPGSRPWAWWLHEAPEPRRVIDDPDGHVEDGGTFPAFNEFWRSHWGTPFHGNTNHGEPLLVEAQPAYLRRLDLLTPAEAARLTAAHFEPVNVDVWGQEYQEARDHDEEEPR
jgi:hypothetical protein